jgi:peptide/nickel transport system permease protein
VLRIIASHIGATVELMLTSTLLAIVIGAWVGILGAIKRYSISDSLATIGAMVALSIPTFWFGLFVIYVFSVGLGWLPSGNRYTIGDGSFLNQIHQLIGPCIVLALVSTAVWSRYMRSSMLDVINQDDIRTARA